MCVSMFFFSFLCTKSYAALRKSFGTIFYRTKLRLRSYKNTCKGEGYVLHVSVRGNKFTYYFEAKESEGKSLRLENELGWEVCGHYSDIIFLR
jgi:hypothetical protein